MLLPILAGMLLGGGCSVVGVMAEGTHHEKTIPPGYNLRKNRPERLLVFVDSSRYSSTPTTYKKLLSKAITANLTKKAKIKQKSIVTVEELPDFDEDNPVSARMSPVEIGKIAGAEIVLYTLIEEFDVYSAGHPDFFAGTLSTRSILFSVAEEEILWPESETGQRSKVNVNLETDGRDVTVSRLVKAMGHCIVRDYYPCRKDEYRITEEAAKFDEVVW